MTHTWKMPAVAGIATLVALGLAAAHPAAAQTAVFAGAVNGTDTSNTPTGPAAQWRTASVAKPVLNGAIDADNIYGTDGYFLFNPGTVGGPGHSGSRPNPSYPDVFSLPTYVTSVVTAPPPPGVAALTSYGGYKYAVIDNPVSGGAAAIEIGDAAYQPTDNSIYNTVATFTVGQNAPADMRVGYLWGFNVNDAVTGVQVINQTTGDILATDSAAAPNPNAANFEFFDISGAQANDVFSVQTLQKIVSPTRSQIGGLTFDTVTPAPEPSAWVALVIGGLLAGGLMLKAKRRTA